MLPAETFSKDSQFLFSSRLYLCFVLFGETLVISVSPVVQSVVFFFFFPHFLFLHTRPNSLPRQSSTLRTSKITTLLRSRQIVHHPLDTLSHWHTFCSVLIVVGTIPRFSAYRLGARLFPFKKARLRLQFTVLSLAAVRDQPTGCELL
ncbi:hypothetical protein BDV37DRAFT_218069 [Aspergillus pseudonomiae]|uniref:Uncharacterized protein n=1 Tax=Aspergillus pseudonomiae TaxID=1506151 RepID=A0A5N7D0F8_9EURO|nr:uncharacterized protein BDV37DRAFT_218069 [Aspergillus pseudonomiae]KAE8399905.1 hypothetical protein BDV37DRAFT_218069 [Aspergillus pseudonomiae]